MRQNCIFDVKYGCPGNKCARKIPYFTWEGNKGKSLVLNAETDDV